MKLAWLSTLVLFTSMNAFAACPYGTQGSTKWDEAVGTVKRILSQNLQSGSHAIEIAKDGHPLKINFDNVGGKVQITVLRSTDGLKYNTTFLQGIADVCSGDGVIKIEAGGYEVGITTLAGNKLAVSTAIGTFTFAAISTETTVATTPGVNR
jgi:hypothetical protein